LAPSTYISIKYINNIFKRFIANLKFMTQCRTNLKSKISICILWDKNAVME
jgi:hypothetical protein